MNDESVLLTALGDILTSCEEGVSDLISTINVVKGGTPRLAGFCHMRVMVVEEIFTTLRVCGTLGGPVN